MDNTLEYINILPFDIKLIIESKLLASLLLKLKIQDRVAELIFRYRYPETYIKFNNIIKINKSLDFDDYVSEGPYFWHIILKDELSYESKYPRFNHDIGPVLLSWEYTTDYVSPTGITMHCLSDIYRIYPRIYKYLNMFMNTPVGIMLFNDSLEDVLSLSPDQSLDDFLITGELPNMGISIGDDFTSLSNIIVIYFLLHFLPSERISTDYGEIDYTMENVDSDRFMEETPDLWSRYNRYSNLYDVAYKYIKDHR